MANGRCQVICAALARILLVGILAGGVRGSSIGEATADEDPPETDKIVVHYDYIEGEQLRGGSAVLTLPPAEPGIPARFLHPLAVTTVTILADNGPPENRIDLVFLGDGYTRAELGTYAAHVQTILGGLMAEEPLASYSDYFNVYRVDVVSRESGVDKPEDNPAVYRDTALDMSLGCKGISRLLCVNTGKAAAAAENAPEADIILTLGNLSDYGGAGYPSIATVAAGNSHAIGLALHEFGHAFADLADEYSTEGETYRGSEPTRANASKYDANYLTRRRRKWYRWLDLPNVDSYEGAMRYEYGIYRPTENSKMRSMYRPFESVNTEQFVINFYKFVSPVDEATAASPKPLPGDTEFFVSPLQPTGHILDVQWSLDGEDVPGATGPDFTALQLEPGIHDVAVMVVDNTPLVRDENARAKSMTKTRSWRIEVSPRADLNEDARVNFKDYAILADQWKAAPGHPSADIAAGKSNGLIDSFDLAVLVEQWLLRE